MKKLFIIAVAVLVMLTFAAIALAQGDSIVARHLHMAGADSLNECLQCHGVRGQSELPFGGGRISNMGGGEDCLKCHDGTHPQAPDFSEIINKLGDCSTCHTK